MAYVASFCLLPTLGFVADFGNLEGELESWNADLELSLILCVPLLAVIVSALWHFRRMPIFAVITILIGLFHIGDTLGWYFSNGFIKGLAPGFELELAPLNCLLAALVWGVPFLVIYFVWLFWRGKEQPIPKSSTA